MLGNEDRNTERLQSYQHPSLDFAFVTPIQNPGTPILSGTAHIRISLPEIRVRSAVSVVFEADDPNQAFDLTAIHNEITGFACIKTRLKVARVGEIWGKNAVPLVFPKSKIEGIKVETQETAPFIDLIVTVGNPGVKGRWSVYYMATSDNKLKHDEWDRYCSQVTANIQSSPLQLRYIE
jgi:hypothetical protein